MVTINNAFLLLHELESDVLAVYHKKTNLNKNSGKNEKNNFFSKIRNFLSGYFYKSLLLYFKSQQHLRALKKIAKSDYQEFLNGNDRERDDIYLKWETIKTDADEYSKIKLNNISFLLMPAYNNINSFLKFILVFQQKLKEELYGNLNRSYSQKELEKMAEKYKDIPPSILNNVSSDKYSARYL